MLITGIIILFYIIFLTIEFIRGKIQYKYAIFSLFYLTIAIRGYLNIISPNLYYLEDIYLIALILIPVLSKPSKFIINKRVNLILLFMAVFILLYIFNSQNTFNAIKEARLYYLYPLLFLLPSIYDLEVDEISNQLIIVSSLLIFIGIIDYFYPGGLIRQYYPIDEYWRSGFSISAIGTYGNRVNYGLGASMLFVLSIEEYFKHKKWVYLIPLGISFLGVVFSHSKTSIYAVVIYSLILLILVRNNRKEKTILFFSILIMILYLYIVKNDLKTIILQTNFNLSGRNYLWAKIITLVSNNIFGVGLGIMGNYKLGAVDNTFLKIITIFGIQSILILIPLLIILISKISKSIYSGIGFRLLLLFFLIGFTIDIMHILCFVIIIYILIGITISEKYTVGYCNNERNYNVSY